MAADERPPPGVPPCNLGEFDPDDVNVFTGVVGAAECGDMIRLQLKINDAGVIEDARFKTSGCGNAAASTSHLTEILKGTAASGAGDVKSSPASDFQCLLPARVHCSLLAEDAVKAAIEDWRRRTQKGPGAGAGE